jgi:pimeloyl-ACP methyl ester carboxylesterase
MTGDLELYHEVRGAGPVVLLVPPVPGDGGQFEALAAALNGYTVVTYDRRGTSRSPRPRGWTATTVAEQADDAADLLRRVTSDSAVIYGTSNGAMIGLELALRHPESVSMALLHEPPLLSVLADPEPVGRMLGELIGAGMERGGPVGALDAFLRFAYGDGLVDQIDPALRARMDANAATVFSIELPGFQAYRPDEGALRSLGVPVRLLVGEDQALPFFGEAATWLAERLGTSVVTSPGAHGPHWSHPVELAALISRHASGG